MKQFFVFDVESVGLYGEGFAVGGGVFLENGAIQNGFCFASDPHLAFGRDEDRKWVDANIPVMEITHRSTSLLRAAFWNEWLKARTGGALMAADCAFPVEHGFIAQCILDDFKERSPLAPYPLVEISSLLLAAGMEPVGTYDREPSELPKHNPYCDAVQSARMLATALAAIKP